MNEHVYTWLGALEHVGLCTQEVHVRVPDAVGCVRRGHLVTPTMLWSL